MKKLLPMLAAGLIFAAQPVLAAAPAPDYNNNPLLATVARSGSKLYYLGNRYGMDGWFIIKDGQVQIAYATPDNKGIVAGALFGQDGENLTSSQLGMLMVSNDELRTTMERLGKEQASMAYAKASPTQQAATEKSGVSSGVQLSPGERLIKALSNDAASITVGPADKPELLMVMSPFCNHCHATWKALRDRVAKGDLQVRLIPINSSEKPEEGRAGAMLLQNGNFDVWDKFVAGDQAQLAGTPAETAVRALAANRTLTDSWKIDMTPYLVYRGKDGKVKIVMGEPANLAVIYTDLGVP